MPGPFTRRGMVARACYNRAPSDRIHSLGTSVKPFPARADLDVAPDEGPDGSPGRDPLLARRRDPGVPPQGSTSFFVSGEGRAS